MGAQKTLAHWKTSTNLSVRCRVEMYPCALKCPGALSPCVSPARAKSRPPAVARRQPPSCIFEVVVLNLYVTRTNHHTHCDRHPEHFARRRVRATSYRAPIRTKDTCGARRTQECWWKSVGVPVAWMQGCWTLHICHPPPLSAACRNKQRQYSAYSGSSGHQATRKKLGAANTEGNFHTKKRKRTQAGLNRTTEPRPLKLIS